MPNLRCPEDEPERIERLPEVRALAERLFERFAADGAPFEDAAEAAVHAARAFAKEWAKCSAPNARRADEREEQAEAAALAALSFGEY